MPMHTTCLLNTLSDKEIIPYLLKDRFNFSLFRMPGEQTAYLYVAERLIEGANAEQSEGFIFSEFNNNSFKCIPADYVRIIKINERICIEECRKGKDSDKLFTAQPVDYENKDYLASVSRIIETLKNRGGKTVFAATHNARMQMSVFEAFTSLCVAYPSAFIYCWHTADSPDLWIGATPELLVSLAGATLKTMALAGTRKAAAAEREWDAKNVAEQKMVTDFVTETCQSHGLQINRQETHTRNAGVIEHICTDIEATIPDNFNIFDLIKDLSPTPAVAGLPRAEAIADIAREENFNRKYYSGLCGICRNDTTDIFVTLRCLKVNPDTKICTLFAGGGITAQSVPALEWQEINAKMSVLANVLKLYN